MFVNLMSFPTPGPITPSDEDNDFFDGLDRPEISLKPVLMPLG